MTLVSGWNMMGITLNEYQVKRSPPSTRSILSQFYVVKWISLVHRGTELSRQQNLSHAMEFRQADFMKPLDFIAEWVLCHPRFLFDCTISFFPFFSSFFRYSNSFDGVVSVEATCHSPDRSVSFRNQIERIFGSDFRCCTASFLSKLLFELPCCLDCRWFSKRFSALWSLVRDISRYGALHLGVAETCGGWIPYQLWISMNRCGFCELWVVLDGQVWQKQSWSLVGSWWFSGSLGTWNLLHYLVGTFREFVASAWLQPHQEEDWRRKLTPGHAADQRDR